MSRLWLIHSDVVYGQIGAVDVGQEQSVQTPSAWRLGRDVSSTDSASALNSNFSGIIGPAALDPFQAPRTSG